MDDPTAAWPHRPLAPRPPGCNAALVLADGTVFWGCGIGATGQAVGEVCFNTAITGYQEILTDPSYAGQIITFTFPHIGNVGANSEDIETTTPPARGVVVRNAITGPSNYRAEQSLDAWLKSHNIVGLTGVDTRRLTRLIRDKGAPNGVIAHAPGGRLDLAAMHEAAAAWPGLEGMDLAKDVSCRQTYDWDETTWRRETGYGRQQAQRLHVVAVDYGAKFNILRMLAEQGCRVTVVPATASAEDILRHRPDGVFLSNGPGDPAKTGEYAVPVLRELIAAKTPIFGICLGHQLLALALGGRTYKLDKGHRGANHPVRDEGTGKVEITSQNHGFAVDPASLPAGIDPAHISLFDGTNEGLSIDGLPVFSVQYHPEASPGPQDSHYLFQRFIDLMAEGRDKSSEAITLPLPPLPTSEEIEVFKVGGSGDKSLIDPPPPFSSIEELEDFLERARHWDQDDSAVLEAIRDVERALKGRREAG
jgi:carbamoyl-phosphate synthase small subunit